MDSLCEMAFPRKPGLGWRRVSNCVFEHDSGIALHVSGLLRTDEGRIVSANIWPESKLADFATLVSGGNRRRGLMLWAMAVVMRHRPLRVEQRIARVRL